MQLGMAVGNLLWGPLINNERNLEADGGLGGTVLPGFDPHENTDGYRGAYTFGAMLIAAWAVIWQVGWQLDKSPPVPPILGREDEK